MKTSVATFVALLFAAGLAGHAYAAGGRHARHSSDQIRSQEVSEMAGIARRQSAAFWQRNGGGVRKKSEGSLGR